MTLSQLLEERAAEHTDRPFLFWQDESISYRELLLRAEAIARALRGQGIGEGDRVAIKMPNSPRYVEWLFGIWRAGAVACPINPALTDDEAGYIIGHARPVLVVDSSTAMEAGQGSLGPHPEPAALASLIYTSGTTGRPKGVMLTHANYLWDAETTVRTIGLSAADRFLCILPLFHVNAQVVTVVCPLVAGGQTVLLPRFAPDTFLSDVARYRATIFSAVPTVYAILLTRPAPDGLDLSSLRFGICGAAPMPAEIFERFEARFGIRLLEGYGLSEATCVSSVNPVDGVRKVGSIGLPLPGQDMRIDAASGQVGEILVRGPNVMQGYFEDEAATSTVLKDGWLHTGDLGVQDTDGYFTIVGRAKDMIIRGGENIYPKEIEEVLHRHPDVVEAAVVGMPDPVWGETVLAVVVARTAVHPTQSAVSPTCSAVSEASINAWCEQHLAAFKRPARIVFMAAADLPRTPTGKLQKHLLRTRL